MPDDQRVYFSLFNRIRDALRRMEETNYGHAASILKQAHTEGEELSQQKRLGELTLSQSFYLLISQK